MKNRTLKAEQLPSGSWRVRVYLGEVNGKKTWKSVTADTASDALRKAALFEMPTNEEMTVLQACERYIREKSEGNTPLSPSTLRGYLGTVNEYIKKDKLGGVKIHKVDTSMLQTWIGRMNVSKKSKKNHLYFVLAVLKYFEIDKIFRVRLAEPDQKELYTPTVQEINAVIAQALKQGDDELVLAIHLGKLGMRRGEICALNAEDFDRQTGHVYVTKAYAKSPDGTFVLKAPKTKGSRRAVPVTPEILDMLPESGPIISYSPDCLTNRFAHVVKRAGVHPFRFHDLRSFFASSRYEMGISDRTAQDLGGWETDRIMNRNYTRSIPDWKQRDEEAIILFHSRNFITKQG